MRAPLKVIDQNPFWFYEPLNAGILSSPRKEWLSDRLPAVLVETFGSKFSIPPAFDSQLSIHNDISDTIMIMGGNQSGKSVSSTIEIIISLTGFIPFSLEKTYPKTKILAAPNIEGRVICASDKVLQNVVLRNFKKWIPKEALVRGEWSSSYNRLSRALTLRTHRGDDVHLEFWTYNQKVDTHQGASLVWLLFDEIPPFKIFQENQARLLAAEKYRIIFAATPTHQDTNWLNSFLRREAEEYGTRVGKYQLSTIHNPKTNLRVVEQMIKTAPNLDVVKMRLFGDFISTTGFVYADLFRRKAHLCAPFKIDDNYVIVRGIDPHLSKPTVVVDAAIDRDHAVYLCGLYSRRADIDSIKADLHQRSCERNYRLYSSVIDQSANYNNALWGKNLYAEFRRSPNPVPLLSLSRRGPGIIEGDIRRIRDYLAKNRFFIFDTPEMRPLIYAMETIERGADRRTHRIDHVLESQQDSHACLRYIFQASLRYIDKEVVDNSAVKGVPNYYV